MIIRSKTVKDINSLFSNEAGFYDIIIFVCPIEKSRK